MASKDYRLVFGSLKEGIHEFNYQLTREFFDDLDQDLISNGLVDVLLKVERSERHMSLDFALDGWVEKTCDVCLSDLQYPIHAKQHLHVKITDKDIEDEADLVRVGSNDYEIDLRGHLFDYVVLSLPMKIVCKDSINREHCDEKVSEMLAGEDDGSRNADHPEWQKLKEIFKN